MCGGGELLRSEDAVPSGSGPQQRAQDQLLFAERATPIGLAIDVNFLLKSSELNDDSNAYVGPFNLRQFTAFLLPKH